MEHEEMCKAIMEKTREALPRLREIVDDIVDNGLVEGEVDTLAQIYQIVHYLMEDAATHEVDDARPTTVGSARA